MSWRLIQRSIAPMGEALVQSSHDFPRHRFCVGIPLNCLATSSNENSLAFGAPLTMHTVRLHELSLF
jgi:hypothetical protein